MLEIGKKKFLSLIKLKIQFLGLMLLMTWGVKKSLEVFMKKKYKKLVQNNLKYKKYLKEKVINCMSNRKVWWSRFNSWIDKKDLEWIFINESFKWNFIN